MPRFPILFGLFLSAALAGCQTAKQPQPDASIKTGSILPSSGKSEDAAKQSVFRTHRLAGRVLNVSSIADIRLADKELVLSFDDGPIPGKTDRVLATLDSFGVKGAFMMVGEMAALHPELARKVAADGNTIGSHTYKHANLTALNFETAMAEVAHGEAAVTKATGTEVNFFRFPYLADSSKLRAGITMREMVVLDVDIDSKDYYRLPPSAVLKRTMDLVHKRGRGIVLLHDIHTRTASLLPSLLSRLETEGYKIVTLKFKKRPSQLEVAAS